MTAKQIHDYEMEQIGWNYSPLWLKEIAYQLAVFNERQQDAAHKGLNIRATLCASNDVIPVSVQSQDGV